MKSAGIHLLSQYSFIHTQPFSFLDKFDRANFPVRGPSSLNPHYPRMLCAKFGWNWPSGSWEEDENVKSLLTDGNTDRWQTDWRQVIRKAHLSFQLGKLKTEGFIDVNITFFVCLGFFSHKRITWGSVKRCKFWPILKGLKALRVTWVSLWEFEVLSLTRL